MSAIPGSLLFVDPLSEGHQSFNRLYLESLGTIGRVIFAARSDYELGGSLRPARIDLPVWPKKIPGKVGYRIEQLATLLAVWRIARRLEPQAIVFSSYETISMALLGRLFRWPTYIINHNNLDEVLESRIKRWFYDHLPGSLKQIVFEDRFREISAPDALVIPHPIATAQKATHKSQVSSNRATNSIARVFAPSGQQCADRWNRLLRKLGPTDNLKVVMKSGVAQMLSQNGVKLVARDWFDDYEEQMRSSDAVASLVDFQYRVSGVVYEALAMGIPVIVSDTPFGRTVREQCPSLVALETEISDLAKLKQHAKSTPENAEHSFLETHSVNAIAKRWSVVLPR